MFRTPRFESPKLRKLCHQPPVGAAPNCFIRIPGVCTGGPTECVHSDAQKHGRGVGNTTHDFNSLPGCRACHDYYSRNQDETQPLVDKGLDAWRWHLFENKLVRVT